MGYTFEVNREKLSEYAFAAAAKPSSDPGEIVLEIDRYAFSANNITYAHLGVDFRYWDFFPASRQGFGIVPVWGFARVIESGSPEIQAGEELYGYFPMGTYAKLKPGKVREAGFADTSEQRSKLPAAYQQYTFLKNDPMHVPELADHELIFRPLYVTSYLLDDYLREKSFFNAERLLITSASSKTAIALAHLLKEAQSPVEVSALTSKGNLEFVKSLGLYDSVYVYEELERAADKSCHVVDFAGNQTLLSQAKAAIGARFLGATLVGIVQWEQDKDTAEKRLGEVFFAPAQIKKRSREWGLDGFQKNLTAAWRKFLPRTNWIEIQPVTEQSEIASMYLETLNGHVPARKGSIVEHRRGGG